MFKLEDQISAYIDRIKLTLQEECAEFEGALPEKELEKIRQKACARARKAITSIMEAADANPLKYFCPSGKQEEYIKAVGYAADKDHNGSRTPIVAFFGGNGSGKTQTTVQILCNIILGPQNGWFDYPMFRNFPFPKKIWYVSESDAIKAVVVPEMKRVLKQHIKSGFCKFHKDGKAIEARVTFKNGFELIFKTYEQEAKQFESDTVGLIISDEPAPENIWRACKSRRRRGCLMLVPMTPLYAPPYLQDEIESQVTQEIPGYSLIQADIYSACKIRGTRGYLEYEDIEGMIKNYSAEEMLTRVEGKPGFYFGTVYSEFNDNIHVVKPDEFPLKKDYIYKHIVDPHEGRGNAEIWLALTPEGRIIIFAESPNFDFEKETPFWKLKEPSTVEMNVERIKQKEELLELTYHIDLSNIKRIIDKRFSNKIGKSVIGEKVTTLNEDYRKLKLIFQNSYTVANGTEKELHYGHNKVRQALKYMPDGKPGLVIYDNCRHTINGFKKYIYKRNVSHGTDDRSGEVVEMFKDFPDVIRYGVCDNRPVTNFEDLTKRYENMKHETNLSPVQHAMSLGRIKI